MKKKTLLGIAWGWVGAAVITGIASYIGYNY